MCNLGPQQNTGDKEVSEYSIRWLLLGYYEVSCWALSHRPHHHGMEPLKL